MESRWSRILALENCLPYLETCRSLLSGRDQTSSRRLAPQSEHPLAVVVEARLRAAEAQEHGRYGQELPTLPVAGAVDPGGERGEVVHRDCDIKYVGVVVILSGGKGRVVAAVAAATARHGC